jgi:alpha-mannosidase
LLGTNYPREALDEGWQLILTNQFHDILPGSAISQVYEDSEQDFLRLSTLGQEVLDTSLGALAAGIGLDSDALVVFNPSPYPSSDYVEVTAQAASGVRLPSRPTVDGGVVVWCEGVPPNGYRAISIGAAPGGEKLLRVSPSEVDTPFWHIELDERGRMRCLTDKVNDREVLPEGEVANRLVIFEDKPLNFDAWDIDAFFHAKSREVDQLESIEVRESGPERAMLELHWRTGDRTRITQRLCVYARTPRVDFQTHVEWQERQSLLKVAFPTTIRSRRATYEIQSGRSSVPPTAIPAGRKQRSKSRRSAGRTSPTPTCGTA